MARIGSYPIDAVIQDKDAWIGTQNTNRVTRQFTALGVAEYIDTKNVGLVFVGATNLLDGAKGLVPAPVAGQEGMYLKGNLGGGWTTIPVYTLDVPAGTTNVNLINTDGAGAIINSFITLTGGTYLTSVHTSGTQITFNHDLTTRTDTASASSPAAGGTVNLVSSVTSNTTGHITAIDVKTVTWPADSDTTYTIDVPNATTSINLAGSDGTNDPIAFTTVAGNNGMTISRTDANTLNFNSKWQINTVNTEGYVSKGQANANKFWATDGNGNPGWTFQPSQDQTLTSTGTTNASTGIVLSQNGGTVIVKGDGSTISASSNNTTNTITLAAINRVNTTYTLPVAAGAANTAVINLTDNSAIVSSVTFNGTANKIAISETVGNNGDITISMPDDVTVTGELTVSGTGQSSFGGQVTIPQTPTADTDAASKKYVDDLVSGGLTFRGTFNAATGEILSGVSSGSKLYNCPGGAGTRIAVAVGDYYIVATAGGSFYCSGATLDIGDSIIATAAAGADASVVTGWSVVQSDEGVASFTNANGTFVSAGTVNSNATGAVTMGTIDLSATGTKDGTTFLRGDNTWAIPAYVSYSAMTTSTLGLGKIKYDFGSTPAAESQSTVTARTYGVTKNASDQLVVNVPWLNSSDVNSVTASGATTALSGLSSTPNTGAVVIGLDINGRASLGSPAGDDELMIYDTSTAKNVKVLVSDLASYAGSAATNQVTYWTSANEIGGATGFTFAGGANGAVAMGGTLTVAADVNVGGSVSSPASVGTIMGVVGRNGVGGGTAGIVLKDYDNDAWDIWNSGGGLNFRYNNDASVGFGISSSGAATFAGKIICNNVGNDRKIEFNRTGANVYSIEHDSAFLYFYNVTANSIPLKLANNNDATFAGNVTANGVYSAGQSAIIYKAQRNGGAVAGDWSYDDATTDMSLGTSTAHSFSLKTGNTRALTINSSQNSTFAGDVSVEDNLYLTDAGAVRGKIQLNSSDRDDLDIKAVSLGSNMKFFTVDTERMRINSSGNVQIGNDSSATPELLTLQAYTQNQAFSGKYSASGYLWFLRNETGPSGRFQLMNAGSTTINLEGNATRDNYILGNVGIGTTSPDYELQVGDGTATETINIKASSTNPSRIFFSDNNAIAQGRIHYEHGGDYMNFWTDNTERMRIDSSGNMQFNGNATISSNTADGSDNAQIIIAGGGTDGDTRGASVHISGNESGNGGLLQLRAGNGSISQIRSYTSGVERMRITSAGDVQIGNVTGAKLSISGSVGTTNGTNALPTHTFYSDLDTGMYRASANTLGFTTGGTERMRILSGGDVCIGTTTPSSNNNYGTGDLNVENNTFASAQIFSHSSTVGNYSFLGLGKSSGTGASPTIVVAQETVGAIGYYGYDGSDYKRLASIDGAVDGTPGAGDMPGRLIFSTTADGASTPTERMRIRSGGGIINHYRPGISVGQTAVGITSANTYGGIAMVWMNYAGNIGYDLVSWSLSQVTVLSSQAISGGTSSRTYTSVSGILKLQMGGSDTYATYVSDITNSGG